MRFTYFLLFVVLGPLDGFSQDMTVQTLTYPKGIELNEIPMPGGPFLLKQACTTEIDSMIPIDNINIKNKNSQVGLIKSCIFEWQVRQDSLFAVTIETFNRKQTDLAIKQAIKQYGEPRINIRDGHTVYNWMYEKEDSHLKAEMLVDDLSKGSKLVVSME